jgi:unsaturated rhamnogalacturonyl hydrolase
MIRFIRQLYAFLTAGVLSALASATPAAELAAPAVVSALKLSAEWQLANPSGTETRDWIIAPLYDGLLRTALTTGDAKYLAAVLRAGTQSGWMPSNRVYHADDHAAGHAWLDIYQMDPSRKERLTPMQERLSYVIANPVTELLAHGSKPKTKGVTVSDRWSWCDALYMAPPTLTRLGDRQKPRISLYCHYMVVPLTTESQNPHSIL